MTLHVALTHRTTYRYERAVGLGPHTIRLRPTPHARTRIVAYSLTVEPARHTLNWQQDPQANLLARVVFPDPVIRLDVTVDLVAELAAINPFDFFLEPDAETWPFDYDERQGSALAPFRAAPPPGPLLAALLDETPAPQPTVELLVWLNRRIRERVAHIVRLEPGVLSPEQTLLAGRGSCRDSAWLLVQALRHLGFAARFVSGYLVQLARDIPDPDAPGPASDFSDLHAWAEAYVPGAGWIGLDATSGLLTAEGHIPLAATPEPASAAAISGLVEHVRADLEFEITVRRLRETPRVSRPYTEAAWQAILAAGEAVDRALDEADVRLTMSAQPAFITVPAFITTDPEEASGPATPPHARSWSELVSRNGQLYAAAGAEGLATGLLTPDGRHLGTGDTHLVLGAAEPADSPFLRRPDLLRSLLGFWHNHPGLAGLFSRPAARPGRLDAADDAAVIKCCAFETPPDPRLAAVQMLVVRAAVAAFWNRPYRHRLIRWGARLHDDFMLPHFVEDDVRSAIEELARRGVALEHSWFAPHLAFRFPVIGEAAFRGINLELRHALAPSHAPGEERLQARVTFLAPERYVLCCAGRAIPLASTGRAGEYVGGIRFQARSAAMPHPTIIVELHDRWNRRSVGGVTYHLTHPGGREDTLPPINAAEAEARSRARFLPFGHAPGETDEPLADIDRDHPRTLDLRSASLAPVPRSSPA